MHDELLPGARTAIVQCLGVKERDRVLIVTDEETRDIADALAIVACERHAHVEVAVLEAYGDRPLTEVPKALERFVRSYHPTVSIFAAQGQLGEIRFRIPFGLMLNKELQTRHGHMIGISRKLMTTGMCVDYENVAAFTLDVYRRVRQARHIHVTSPLGTNLHAHFDPLRIRWIPWTGLYHEQGDWGNLPEGETFSSPVNVDGTLAVSLVGDHFSKTYGLLDSPLFVTVQHGQVVNVAHDDARLASELWDYLSRARNGTRIGEFAIGTNLGLKALTGNLLQDEKYPGVHVAFGDPYGHLTGAAWTSDVHVDVIPLEVDVHVDGIALMQCGQFVRLPQR
jgi:aminopeptidase